MYLLYNKYNLRNSYMPCTGPRIPNLPLMWPTKPKRVAHHCTKGMILMNWVAIYSVAENGLDNLDKSWIWKDNL